MWLQVADVPNIRKQTQIWVAPDEECVVTRFLFAFPNGIDPGGRFPADSTEARFEEEVRGCIAALEKAAAPAVA